MRIVVTVAQLLSRVAGLFIVGDCVQGQPLLINFTLRGMLTMRKQRGAELT